MTTSASEQRSLESRVLGIADLIREAERRPPREVISGLLHENEILGLHGQPETFKTTLLLQLADSLATGKPFLGVWSVPHPLKVYFCETEMSISAVGTRLLKMYRGKPIPTLVGFPDEGRLRRFRKAADLGQKFALLREWIEEHKSEVVILDTANPFFRGKQSPNDETTVGEFFDLMDSLPAPTRVFARHNHKPRIDDSGDGASRIRGSGQFADVPDLLMELQRTDRRTNEASLEITKFRHGSKPEPIQLWLDESNLQLISVPPVIHLLREGALARAEILDGLQKRFGIEQRKADDLIADQRPFLLEEHSGHKKVLSINPEASRSADWLPRLSLRSEADNDTQHCIIPSVPQERRGEVGSE